MAMGFGLRCPSKEQSWRSELKAYMLYPALQLLAALCRGGAWSVDPGPRGVPESASSQALSALVRD